MVGEEIDKYFRADEYTQYKIITKAFIFILL
ncbi:MAG: hypothetical protein K0R06_751 [Clostridium sp.]|jgi:hypothetical protein|nr:hypothetical protein [Clostridium sp.]